LLRWLATHAADDLTLSDIARQGSCAMLRQRPGAKEVAMATVEELVRACFQAYVAKDRAAIERLIAPVFSFTSPLDNQLDRRRYFELCWPNSEHLRAINIRKLFVQGNEAFVLYDGEGPDGKRFRNTEFFAIEGGQIARVEVYFGWDLPHAVAFGEHQDPT
jgi:hypothetical protein